MAGNIGNISKFFVVTLWVTRKFIQLTTQNISIIAPLWFSIFYLFLEINFLVTNMRIILKSTIVRLASEILGGKGGGGRPDMAQAGGSDPLKAIDAIDAIRGKM